MPSCVGVTSGLDSFELPDKGVTLWDPLFVTFCELAAVTFRVSADLLFWESTAATFWEPAAVTFGDLAAVTAGEFAAVTFGESAAVTFGELADVTAGESPAPLSLSATTTRFLIGRVGTILRGLMVGSNGFGGSPLSRLPLLFLSERCECVLVDGSSREGTELSAAGRDFADLFTVVFLGDARDLVDGSSGEGIELSAAGRDFADLFTVAFLCDARDLLLLALDCTARGLGLTLEVLAGFLLSGLGALNIFSTSSSVMLCNGFSVPLPNASACSPCAASIFCLRRFYMEKKQTCFH